MRATVVLGARDFWPDWNLRSEWAVERAIIGDARSIGQLGGSIGILVGL